MFNNDRFRGRTLSNLWYLPILRGRSLNMGQRSTNLPSRLQLQNHQPRIQPARRNAIQTPSERKETRNATDLGNHPARRILRNPDQKTFGQNVPDSFARNRRLSAML